MIYLVIQSCARRIIDTVERKVAHIHLGSASAFSGGTYEASLQNSIQTCVSAASASQLLSFATKAAK